MYNIEEIESMFNQHGTSKTNNEKFDESGFVLVRNIIDPNLLKNNAPEESGLYHYYGDKNKFSYQPVENQVPGSTSRYYWPEYKEHHISLKKKIEDIIGKKLYQTYYYDRFYLPGQDLSRHTDRDACEISMTVHIGSNLNKKWPFWIKNGNGDNCAIYMNPGDGVIYKGCERTHWRDPMPDNSKISKLFNKQKIYYHQIFFHYVLADGNRSHCAFDAAR